MYVLKVFFAQFSRPLFTFPDLRAIFQTFSRPLKKEIIFQTFSRFPDPVGPL
jgi:hypothetical protein